MVKRVVDIFVSFALLVIALPVLALAAVMIVVSSPGPVLFRQVRMGRGFRPFKILKLRTMAHAEAGLAFTLGPDPRITDFGKLLRRTKLDELPQLWNVLCGEMSLVGPRPVLPELAHEFREEYAVLLRVRPGLTDPASLKYSQEARLLAGAEDPMRFFKTVVTPDKIRMSREYMERAGLWTDIRVLLMTAVICCFPALSRMYGELPVLLRARAVEGRAAPQVDEAIFSHELAYLEAAVEERLSSEVRPWIPLPGQHFGSRSASGRDRERASRL